MITIFPLKHSLEIEVLIKQMFYTDQKKSCQLHFQHYLLCVSRRMLLRYAFSQLRSTEIAVVHCSAQTTSRHLLQKLSQTCMVISTNTGRVYRPKDCERLVLYLKDINLPKLDKWGTSTLVAFLQQVSLIPLCLLV